jgi:hypothetical protein
MSQGFTNQSQPDLNTATQTFAKLFANNTFWPPIFTAGFDFCLQAAAKLTSNLTALQSSASQKQKICSVTSAFVFKCVRNYVIGNCANPYFNPNYSATCEFRKAFYAKCTIPELK